MILFKFTNIRCQNHLHIYTLLVFNSCIFSIYLISSASRNYRDLDPHDLEFTEFCLDQIFSKYGTRDLKKIEKSDQTLSTLNTNINTENKIDIDKENRIDFWEFSHLLSRIGLMTPEWNDSSHNHNAKSDKILTKEINNNLKKHSKLVNSKRSIGDQKVCLSPVSIFQHFNISPVQGLTKHDFAHLCPVLIFQLDQDECRKRIPDHESSFSRSGREHVMVIKGQNLQAKTFMHTLGTAEKRTLLIHTWLYALLAVSVISLFGFGLVCLIPLIRCKNFHYLLQFFVSLAIGSLSGDALLHLIPHAIVPGEGAKAENQSHDTHEMVWKGFLALCIIFAFFTFERLAFIFPHMILSRKRRPAHGTPPNTAPGRSSIRLAQNERYQPLTPTNPDEPSTYLPLLESSKVSNSNDYVAGEESARAMDPKHRASLEMSKIDHRQPPLEKFLDLETKVGNPAISAQALTVVFGDGIHNFFDGVAIGAAFAGNITAGISTALAVLCHELPHEIGDFAYLLKLGIRIRHAFWFNCLSTLFCIVGCVAGLSLGAFHSASSWIFAAIGGMFLYIALVNMLPELKDFDKPSLSHSHGHSHTHHASQSYPHFANYPPPLENVLSDPEEHIRVMIVNNEPLGSVGAPSCRNIDLEEPKPEPIGSLGEKIQEPVSNPAIALLLQLSGIGLGVLIMLLIALYEEDIKRLIS